MELLLLLLLLLAAMTYNQVQYFRINYYANHYVDIEITGYRVLTKVYWAQQSQLTALVVLYWSILIFFGRVQPLLVGPSLSYAPEMRYSINVQDFRSLLA